MINAKKIVLAASLALAAASLFALNESAGVERYGLYIGSNDGGKSHERLLYAGSDAISFQKIMTEIGGISKSNGILLLDPAKEDVDSAFEIISSMMEKKSKDAKRSEFIFYYSGHSDENALLLGKTKYDYSSLKAAITNVPSDVHVVILDSCFSGNFIRTKGGQKQKPFLVDDASVVKGHAYLSSSSSQESSQESDEIGSSFFTNAMITGLRGAADTSGDKKVTLNELYSYAFNETLSKTENTADPQHPNYNITLVGSGDLVLSDVSASDCLLTLSRELTGRIIVRDKNGKLVSEINKTALTPIYLALEEGQYGVTVIGDRTTLQGNFSLSPKKTYALSAAELSPVARIETKARGNSEIKETEQAQEAAQAEASALSIQEKDIWEVPFVFSFICNEFYLAAKKELSTKFSLAVLRSSVYQVNGVMLSAIANETKFLRGFQAAGIYNLALDAKGVQAAGIFNLAQDIKGAQASGILNVSRDLTGVQGSGEINVARDLVGIQGAGLANAARNVTGIQGAGITNFALGDIKGVQGAGILNVTIGGISGVQGAGISNFALGDIKGLQASPILNIAGGNVKGAQIGLINICKGDCAFQLGLINYSRNGVCEIGVSYTSDQMIRSTFSSGSKYFYSIFGFAFDPEWLRGRDDIRSFDLIMGLGARVNVWKFNFDFEALANEAMTVNLQKGIPSKERVKTEWYPTTRVSVGFTPVKHFNVFAGFSMSYEFSWNGDAFARRKNNMAFEAGSLTLHPEFDFGIKIPIN